jgi:hypothetical protein
MGRFRQCPGIGSTYQVKSRRVFYPAWIDLFCAGKNHRVFMPGEIAVLFFLVEKNWLLDIVARICEIELSLKCLVVRPPSLKLTLRA